MPGPSLCRFLLFWAHCMDSSVLGLVLCRLLLCLSCVREPNDAQTKKEFNTQGPNKEGIYTESPEHNESTQTGPRTERTCTNMARTQTKPTQKSPKHENMHKQCLEHKSPCSEPQTEEIYRDRAQTPKQHTQAKPGYKRNLHRQGLEHMSSFSEPNTEDIYREKAQVPRSVYMFVWIYSLSGP